MSSAWFSTVRNYSWYIVKGKIIQFSKNMSSICIPEKIPNILKTPWKYFWVYIKSCQVPGSEKSQTVLSTSGYTRNYLKALQVIECKAGKHQVEPGLYEHHITLWSHCRHYWRLSKPGLWIIQPIAPQSTHTWTDQKVRAPVRGQAVLMWPCAVFLVFIFLWNGPWWQMKIGFKEWISEWVKEKKMLLLEARELRGLGFGRAVGY